MDEMDFDQDLDPISELLELCRGFYIERKAIVDADEDYLAEQLQANAIRMADHIANVDVEKAFETEAAHDTAQADAENEEESPLLTATPALVELQNLPDMQLLTRFEQLISIGNENEVCQMLRLILKVAQDNDTDLLHMAKAEPLLLILSNRLTSQINHEAKVEVLQIMFRLSTVHDGISLRAGMTVGDIMLEDYTKVAKSVLSVVETLQPQADMSVLCCILTLAFGILGNLGLDTTRMCKMIGPVAEILRSWANFLYSFNGVDLDLLEMGGRLLHLAMSASKKSYDANVGKVLLESCTFGREALLQNMFHTDKSETQLYTIWSIIEIASSDTDFASKTVGGVGTLHASRLVQVMAFGLKRTDCLAPIRRFATNLSKFPLGAKFLAEDAADIVHSQVGEYARQWQSLSLGLVSHSEIHPKLSTFCTILLSTCESELAGSKKYLGCARSFFRAMEKFLLSDSGIQWAAADLNRYLNISVKGLKVFVEGCKFYEALVVLRGLNHLWDVLLSKSGISFGKSAWWDDLMVFKLRVWKDADAEMMRLRESCGEVLVELIRQSATEEHIQATLENVEPAIRMLTLKHLVFKELSAFLLKSR